jgi:hypothetical protein
MAAVSGVSRREPERFLDAQQLIVFGDAIAAARRTCLDLTAHVPTARSAMVLSSFHPTDAR